MGRFVLSTGNSQRSVLNSFCGDGIKLRKNKKSNNYKTILKKKKYAGKSSTPQQPCIEHMSINPNFLSYPEIGTKLSYERGCFPQEVLIKVTPYAHEE